jgi:ABC-type polysaccharide/polyol phosphate transport system ATPase subunit
MLTPQLLNLTSALGHQGMKRAEIKRQFDAIADFAEVEKFLDTPVKFYSSGMLCPFGVCGGGSFGARDFDCG